MEATTDTRQLKLNELYDLPEADILEAITSLEAEANDLKGRAKHLQENGCRREIIRLRDELARRIRWTERQKRFEEMQQAHKPAEPAEATETKFREFGICKTKGRTFTMVKDIVNDIVTAYVITGGGVRQNFPTNGKEQSHVFAEACRTWQMGRG